MGLSKYRYKFYIIGSTVALCVVLVTQPHEPPSKTEKGFDFRVGVHSPPKIRTDLLDQVSSSSVYGL